MSAAATGTDTALGARPSNNTSTLSPHYMVSSSKSGTTCALDPRILLPSKWKHSMHLATAMAGQQPRKDLSENFLTHLTYIDVEKEKSAGLRTQGVSSENNFAIVYLADADAMADAEKDTTSE